MKLLLYTVQTRFIAIQWSLGGFFGGQLGVSLGKSTEIESTRVKPLKPACFAVKMREDGTILYQSMLQFFCEIQLVITLDPLKKSCSTWNVSNPFESCEKPIEKTIQSVPQWCRILSMKTLALSNRMTESL